ncbi:hypothetical protein BDN72DRAFT_142178 [Pluteus cervinus]|uniref:Uncharacterized protein n=1 Tax=Pluteus cervinus TaxID=181527 RepID=A0ACD2ZXH8_9AGAR|nr:hypothetical protein BDN72DRAFT_142178 [Pluteus cervinus]
MSNSTRSIRRTHGQTHARTPRTHRRTHRRTLGWTLGFPFSRTSFESKSKSKSSSESDVHTHISNLNASHEVRYSPTSTQDITTAPLWPRRGYKSHRTPLRLNTVPIRRAAVTPPPLESLSCSLPVRRRSARYIGNVIGDTPQENGDLFLLAIRNRLSRGRKSSIKKGEEEEEEEVIPSPSTVGVSGWRAEGGKGDSEESSTQTVSE